jgi:hypothetical protein
MNRAALGLAWLLGATALALPACDRSETPAASQSTDAASTASAASKTVRSDVYEGIRGIVVSLPAPGSAKPEMRIHHEHISTFRTKDGDISIAADGVPGMKSMVMPFPVPEDLDVSSLSAGDKIAFDFVVQWGGAPPWQITAFEKLDPETEIDFANKAPDAPASDDAADDHAGHDHP